VQDNVTYLDFDELSQEEYFGELKLMFQTKGWRILCQELFDNSEVLNNVQDVKDQRDLDFKRGQLATIGYILNFESTIHRAEEEEQDTAA
jgi:hypothetical protein